MLNSLKKKIVNWQKYNRTVAELQSLSNRELSDLGIMRHDIPRIAKESVR